MLCIPLSEVGITANAAQRKSDENIQKMEKFDIGNAINEEGKWETLKSEYLFRRPWLTVRHDQVRLPDGRINPEFYVLEYPDWVNIIAITENGEFVMERQFRQGLGKTCFEIPAGVMEKGETALEAAKRELEEETGYGGGEWKEIMTVSGNCSTTSNLTHCFLGLLVGDKIRQSLMAAPLWKYFAELK